MNEHLKECRNGPASLLETLSRQYVAFPEAKNSVRFNSCCKTAEELRKATESLPCAGIFANIAVLLASSAIFTPLGTFVKPVPSSWMNDSD